MILEHPHNNQMTLEPLNKLLKHYLQKQNNDMNNKTFKIQRNEIFVKKLVDYSSKYGLGYLLNNESSGEYFNDSSKIIGDSNQIYFEQIEKQSDNQQYEVNLCSLNNYPKDIQNKVTLLELNRGYFENYTLKQYDNIYLINYNTDKEVIYQSDYNKILIVYINKWMKSNMLLC